jgi:hypothetical protein
MNLATIVSNSIGKARMAMGSLITTATLLKSTTKTYDVLTGKKTQTTTSVKVDVVVDSFNVSELNTNVLYSDLKVTVFKDPTFEMTLDDKMTIGTITYAILKITPSYVGNDVLVYTVQLRR